MTKSSVPFVAMATVATPYGSRYLQQLAKHSHKLEVQFDPVHATIRFPRGVVASLDADDVALGVHITARDAETRDRIEDVLAEHLDRFAFREAPLPFVWVGG